ncbi:sulfotransferase [Oceanicoccus sp. KOV_DT_Chl]|uniref:sulfotransferase family protein n=1 Tax=Oceanicoccus sp. KOV_DT_Chl TaxID=1904639 RepID=UPI000C7983B8|nr:sulfotransferase [Oceanicoccus sp. KOV_DT_Chl]
MTDEYAIPEVNLETDSLLQEAIATEQGLTDFGDESFRQPFEILIKSLQDEANLNQLGRFMQHQRTMNSLRNRLRMEQWIKQYPEILDEELLPITVIVGLTRTGTTMLHRILASDSRFYAPLWYEVRNPAPYMDWDANGQDQRIAEATAEVEQMLAANPELASIHPMDPVGADEEILLLEHSFYSYVPNSFFHVPTYGDYVAQADNTPAYEYLKKQLQFLQWQKKRRGETAERWLLKAPHHLHFMSTLLKVFPGIQVIATHRDPVVTIPSTASFYYNLWLMGSENPNKLTVADEVCDVFARGVAHTMQAREGNESQFFDAWFKDTVSRPFEVIQEMYDFIGMEFTDEARAAMEQHREDNQRGDRPSHEYTLEEYGYSESSLRQRFADYCQRFID